MVSLESYRYWSGSGLRAGSEDQGWRDDLRRELARIGGHDLEIEERADGFEAVFTVPARDRPDALAIGEKVMRAVNPGGYWYGASRAVRL
jgi:hypothetical protein